jgi:LysM repeat protein
MIVERPARVAITQTLGGLAVDSLGEGIPTTTLTGTTGWRLLQNGLDGQGTYKALTGLVQDHMNALANSPDDPNSQVLIINTAEGWSFRCVHMQGAPFRTTRERSRPLLFQFEWSLQIVQDLSSGIPRSVTASQKTLSQPPAPPPAPTVGITTSTTTPGTQASQPARARVAAGHQNEMRTAAPPRVVPYTIKSGDTLWGIITARYGTYTPALQKAVLDRNPQITNPNVIIAGATLQLPAPGSIY